MTAEFGPDNTDFDPPSAHLAQLGVTLRRREGGPDAGWHLKVPQGLARTEITAGADSATLADELGRLVTGLRAGGEETSSTTSTGRSTLRLFRPHWSTLSSRPSTLSPVSQTGEAGSGVRACPKRSPDQDMAGCERHGRQRSEHGHEWSSEHH